MSFCTTLRGLSCVLLALAGAAGAQAQTPTPHSISGSFGQLFIGRILPIPHPSFGPFDPNAGETFTGMAPTFMGTPVGGAKATTGGYALTLNSGATIAVAPHRITHGGPNNPKPGVNRLLFLSNSAFFQAYTNLSVGIPRTPPSQSGLMSDSAFFVNGRTGINIVTWCPGLTATVTLGLNPACPAPSAAPSVTIPTCAGPASCPGPGILMTPVPGVVRYHRTAGQLGGAARVNLGGTFNVALNAGGATMPGPATVYFWGGSPNPTPAIGGAFGVFNQRAVLSLMSAMFTDFTVNGSLTGTETASGTPPAGLGTNNTIASFGVPFTAGQLVLSVTANFGAPEVFTLTGSDTRTANGVGNITLVGGAVSLRSATGLNANRGVLNLRVPEPPALLGAVAALGALVGCHQWTRRRSRQKEGRAR